LRADEKQRIACCFSQSDHNLFEPHSWNHALRSKAFLSFWSFLGEAAACRCSPILTHSTVLWNSAGFAIILSYDYSTRKLESFAMQRSF